MMSADPDPPPAAPAPPGDSPLVWTDEGQPRSRLYGDIYFSTTDGLAESRAVFLAGCGLPQAWAGRDRFVVGELGFGSGLNVLALLDLWRRTRPAGARLHVFSVEAHPLDAHEAARALAPWPEVADLAGLLVERWPGHARGFHRVELPEVDAILDLAVMEALPALEAWSGSADAWFLDGFSPALNPQMWRDEVLAAVAARSAPGARAATFTVAGAVRRGLDQAGFAVEKQPGFGRKRQRLEARLPGVPPSPGPMPRIAVIGAGVAGASAARALRALGAEVLLVEARVAGAGASGNPAALVTPRLDAALGPLAQLFAQATHRAGQLYAQVPKAILERGVLQLATGDRDPARFARIAGADLYEPDALALVDAAETTRRLGEPVPAGLDQAHALVVDPAPILAAWTEGLIPGAAARLEPRAAGGWRLVDAQGGLLAEADAVIVAAGPASADLIPGLPLGPVRGQATWVAGLAPPAAAAWGGYVAPTRDGLLFGATHDRGDTGVEVREADHRRNLATLGEVLPELAGRIAGARLEGRAGVRAVTPDRLPLAGATGPAGLFVLSGLGSRGFAAAPLLAEHVAALATGAPSPLPQAMAALVDPARFARRAARRGHS